MVGLLRLEPVFLLPLHTDINQNKLSHGLFSGDSLDVRYKGFLVEAYRLQGRGRELLGPEYRLKKRLLTL